MRTSNLFRTVSGGIGLAAFAPVANGVLITINPLETPSCDVLALPTVVHELGNPPLFPADELIETTFTFTNLSACPTMDNPNVPNILLVMVNLSGSAWLDVHYVADVGTPGVGGTSISNEDGLVTAGQAFRIDTIGVNQPLVFESMVANTVFEPGEIWHFIIQDYTNVLGLPASSMGSIGVGFGSLGDAVSSGSIIALPIPGPGGLMAMALGCVVLPWRRRRRS